VASSATLPPPSANARRSLAAERIASAVPRDNLSPVPFVPYAVSLALSVEYRKMRHSRLPMFRARSRAAFKSNCELLRRFGDRFWSARVVAALGELVLREMERTANSIANEAAPVPLNDGGPAEDTSIAGDAGPIRGEASSMERAVSGAITPTLDGLNFTLFDTMPDLDIFGHFDPGFNLPAIDDALEANLDIGLPPNWGDFGQSRA
jgi:hypothetical protein